MAPNRPAAQPRSLKNRATADGAGNLVIADAGNNRVRVVAARTGTLYRKAMTAASPSTVQKARG